MLIALNSYCRLDLDCFEAGKWTLSDDYIVMTLSPLRHWSSYLMPSVWRMAALPKIVEEIVSGVLLFFEFYRFFVWALLMEVVSMS
jgi:hypothetical protein